MESTETLSCGAERERFEACFRAFVAAEFVLAVTNCTVGLELAVKALGLPQGGEVLITAQTYQSTASPFVTGDYNVRFCDVSFPSLCIDVNSVEACISADTAAIVFTNYGGFHPQLERLSSLARKHGAKLIADCAHSLGSSFMGKDASAWVDAAVFSFQSMKNISTLGQGGMIVVRERQVFERLLALRSVQVDADYVEYSYSEAESLLLREGPLSPDIFDHSNRAYSHKCLALYHGGTNATLNEVACAVGVSQLAKLPLFLSRRRQIALAYNEAFLRHPGLSVQVEAVEEVSAHHLYTLFLNSREVAVHRKFLQTLFARGIEIQQRYFPLHLLPEWRLRAGVHRLPNVEALWLTRQVNLPIYPAMSDEQVAYTIAATVDAANEFF